MLLILVCDQVSMLFLFGGYFIHFQGYVIENILQYENSIELLFFEDNLLPF
jgi:hypothetical protein